MFTKMAVGLGVAVTVAMAGVAQAQAPNQFDGQYRGELTLSRTLSGDCTQPPPGSLYPLTIERGEVRFAYIPRFATTLTGRIDARGNFRATARAKQGVVEMRGRVDRSRVNAQIISPSCQYTFQSKDLY